MHGHCRRIYHLIIASLLLAAAIGCSYHFEPEYTAVRYEVGGTAENVTVTAVTDEHGTLETFAGVSLPWELTYENLTQDMFPPVYLHIEVTSRPAALATGTSEASAAEHLVDTGAGFVADGVQAGDVAVDTGSGSFSAITAVTATDLTLTAGDDFFSAGGVSYAVYAMRTLSGAAYGATSGGEVTIDSLVLENWDVMGATFAIDNYTAP